MLEKFKDIYSYDPETGLFTRIKDGNRFDRQIGQVVGSFDNTVGYIRIGITGKVVLAHRLAWFYVYDYYPKEAIDHINGIRTDNRISNLRLVTTSESSKNMAIRKDNSTGNTGITFTKNRYWARIYNENKCISLGRYITLEEAIKVRKEAEIRYNYHKNHGRVGLSLNQQKILNIKNNINCLTGIM